MLLLNHKVFIFIRSFNIYNTIKKGDIFEILYKSSIKVLQQHQFLKVDLVFDEVVRLTTIDDKGDLFFLEHINILKDKKKYREVKNEYDK